MTFNLQRLQELFEKEQNIAAAARKYCEENQIEYTDSWRRKASKLLNNQNEAIGFTLTSESKTNEYVFDSNFSARKSDGKLMDIEEYCEIYGLDFSSVKNFKLITHTGEPFYNIVFFEKQDQPKVSEEELKTLIEEGLSSIKRKTISVSYEGRTGIVKISDLHLGSYVDNLIRTKEFSISILAQKLQESAEVINSRKYADVHVHILGDLIESFTGLNHKNSWKGLDKAMVGAEAVKLVVRILHEQFLSLINNLRTVKIVGGNHDRLTSDNKEDTHAGAADLVCWGLNLIGYETEFNPLVITHTLGNITHILTHGHHALSKKSTKQLCWDYGKQGNYNLICEGHLHSIIEKLSFSQAENYETVRDDSVDHRRIVCPSFFTGNFYSESLGYTSQSGFIITEDNGKGVPNVFYYAI